MLLYINKISEFQNKEKILQVSNQNKTCYLHVEEKQTDPRILYPTKLLLRWLKDQYFQTCHCSNMNSFRKK